ncbi:MAG: starch-binding protein, partial [Ruminococcus sp.]|nr:starch-binding protein [Ruminococcus sp.]
MRKRVRKLQGFVSFLLAVLLAASCFSISATAAEIINSDISAPTESNYYVSDTAGWGKMNIYAWDADGTPLCGEWPGIALYDKSEDEYGYDMYLYSIPEGAYGMIFSDSFDGNQTVEITDLSV